MDTELLNRIRRIHAAVAAAEETDPKKLRATVIETYKMTAMFQDFRGGLTDAQLANQAHSVIQNLANLRDHLTKWAARKSKDKEKVDDALRQPGALKRKRIKDW